MGRAAGSKATGHSASTAGSFFPALLIPDPIGPETINRHVGEVNF